MATTYITVDDVIYSEGDSFATFTVRLGGAVSAGPITLDYHTVDGTALAGSDYTSVPAGQLVIPGGSASGSTFTIQIPVQALGDGTVTAPQGFSLVLSTATVGVALSDTVATALQIDADAVAVSSPHITVGDAIVDETAGVVTFAVTLDAPSTSTVTVDYATQDATAVAGSDYVAQTGTLTLLAGHTSGTITVAINTDAVVEGREMFSVQLSNASGAQLGTTPGADRSHIIIQDGSDPVAAAPVVGLQGSTVSEANGYVDFLVTLTAPSASEVTVDYNTSDGVGANGAFTTNVSADQPASYIAAAGKLTFAPGEVSKVVRVLTLDNNLTDHRDTRSFDLNLTGVTGGAVLDALKTAGVLVDSEGAVPFSPTHQVPVNINNNIAEGEILIGTAYNDSIRGANGADLLDGRGAGDLMEGLDGNDVYIVSDGNDTVNERAGNGSGTDTIISYLDSYTLSSDAVVGFVENLVLGGATNSSGTGNGLNNRITGNAGNNNLSGADGADTLVGAAGNDTLTGGLGVDSLIGGTGDDTYVLNGESDAVVEQAGEGTDTVSTSVSFALGANLDNLVLTGAGTVNGQGNELDNNLTGNGVANTLTGLGGNDTLDGGAGNDILVGGTGNDTYRVDAAGDVITELANEGVDTLEASVNYVLAAGVDVENLTLVGSASQLTGNELDNKITGGELNDSLSGAAGNDSLIGAGGNDTLVGGIGNDAMDGGLGDDTYVVDAAGDVVTEAAGAGSGTDTVQALITMTLGDNVENLVLTGLLAINGTGNALANTITGNDAANTLDGAAGDDVMAGGLGDDSYIVDSAGDTIVESSGIGSGIDTVTSSVDIALSTNVENLALVGTALSGTGNASSNVITGNALANTLSGADGDDSLIGAAGNDTLTGGLGVDTLVGGVGDDLYVVADSTDVVNESAGEGVDLVQATANYTLSGNIENLSLSGAATNGSGNAIGNVITGNSLNNLLDGAGGSDSLIGGAGLDTLLGGDGNDTLNGGTGVDSLVGGAGNDSYFVDSASDVVVEAAAGGSDILFASVNYALAAGVEIETLSLLGSATVLSGNEFNNVLQGGALSDTLSGLAGNDSLVGGAGADTLSGGDGNDSLNGGTGADSLDGGAGNDSYFVDSAADVVVEGALGGTDTLFATVNYALGAGAQVEFLNLLGSATSLTGNEFNNTLSGGTLADTLSGLAGNDSLIGATGADTLLGGDGNDTLNGGLGIDSMDGGLGNDIYFVDAAGDIVSEAIGGGADTLFASVNYTLAAGSEVETLNLLGSANALTGNELANTLVGGGLDDSLTGLDGNDTLNGATGNDTLDGGLGNDSLIGGNGTDSLLGGDGNDILNGGIGADAMDGGLGNDIYFVDSVADVVNEAVGGGSDTVFTTVNFALAAGVEIETLSLAGTATSLTGNELNNTLQGGALNDNLSGLAGNDSLVGAAGNDTLSGGDGNDTLNGGLGSDAMNGGAGNDSYFVDSATDTLVEAVGGGTDTVFASVNYTLATGVEVEAVNLSGTATQATGNEFNNTLAGTAQADTLAGLAGNDSLIGAAGNDTLLGGLGVDTLNGGAGDDSLVGGAGNDVLFGGAGLDTFVFDAVLNAATNVDRIADWGAGDHLELSASVFTALAQGALDATHFFSGAGATGSSSAAQGAGVYYDTTAGSLYYDADGFGGVAAVKFALLTGNPVLTAADVTIGA